MEDSGKTERLDESGIQYRRAEREYAIRQIIWMLEDEGLDWNQEALAEQLGMRAGDVSEMIRRWADRPNTPTRSLCRLIDLVYRFIAGGPEEPPPLHEWTPRTRRKKEAAYGAASGVRAEELDLIYRILERLDVLEARLASPSPPPGYGG